MMNTVSKMPHHVGSRSCARFSLVFAQHPNPPSQISNGPSLNSLPFLSKVETSLITEEQFVCV